MAQHVFVYQYDNQPMAVLMGWNRQGQSLFMDVFTNDESAEMFYSVEADPAMSAIEGGPSVDVLAQKLVELGITVPSDMIEGVRADMIDNRGGNNFTYYSPPR